MIHVAYRLWGGDGFFAKMCGTSMLSMFENTNEKVTVHIMHNDRLTPDNRGKLCYIAGQYNQKIEFHNVEEIAGETLRKFEAAHPIKSGINAAWYPLIVHEVFPNLDKIIFLGTDTAFNLDIAELWKYDWEGNEYALGAVPEILNGSQGIPMVVQKLVDHEDYFNVDVMVLKPAFIRENFDNVLEGVKFVYGKFPFNEQDALNYLYSKKYLKLPHKFNIMPRNMRQYFNKQLIEKAIYHFAGAGEFSKPSLNTDDVYDKLYIEYYFKTPWGGIDIFGDIHKACEKIYFDSKRTLLHFTNLIATRERSFVIDQVILDAARKVFAVKNDEKVYNASDQTEMENFVADITENRGKKIFFILSANYRNIALNLFLHGFNENIDFANAKIFLSKEHGTYIPFDSYSIVKEM